MDYTIRSLITKDEPIVWKMLQYATHESSLQNVRKQPALAIYASKWGRFGDFGCIAERQTLPIGMAWLRLWPDEAKGYGYVSNEIPELAIAVLPDYRGQGIGTNLLTQVLAMGQRHYPGVSLSVRENNPVLRLYQRAGFIKVPGSETVNRAGEVSFNMVRKFESAYDTLA